MSVFTEMEMQFTFKLLVYQMNATLTRNSKRDA